MNTILIPTDFSNTATNAAKYAVELAKQVQAKEIVFYNAYQMPVSTVDAMLPNLQLFNVEDQKKLSESEMDIFVSNLQPLIPASITIKTECEFNLLSEGINSAIESTAAELVVMGITGSGKLEEVLVGSNTVSIAKHSKIPVIIVPPDCTFSLIEEVLLACDFKKVLETTPVWPIRQLLDLTGAELMVLNISDHRHNNPEQSFETLMFDVLLYGYKPSYHFLQNDDFLAAINNFVIKNKVDMIITIPKKHGWFEHLFKRSHTAMLAFHSHVPLMVVHEEKE